MATNADQVGGLQNAGMSYQESAALSASMAMNPDSRLSLHLRSAFARRLAALRHNADMKKQQGRKKRVILPFVLEPERIYDLTKRYAQFELVFRQTERGSGALAKTVVAITVERLFEFVKKSWLPTAAYGMSLNCLVSNNRHWVHLCTPREDIDVSARNVKDDRVMCAMLNSARRKGTPLPMTNMYAKGDLSKMCCGDPVTCKYKGVLGLMMLHETDTNYKQVATWMYQHELKLAYISFVSTKAIEMGYDADIPELDARVVHKGPDQYMLLYKNGVSMGRVFSRKNHLSLVGQTHEVIGDFLFTKEFCGWQDAMAVYKITMVKRRHSYDTTTYRSWLNVGYNARYLISSYKVSSEVSDVFDPKSYEPYQFEISRDIVDKLLAYSRRLEPDVFDHLSIARRLRSLITTTVVGGYSIVSPPTTLNEDEFDHTVLTVYSHVFMENFRTGVSLEFQKSEQAAQAYLSKIGFLRLLPYVFNTMVVNAIVVPFRAFFSWLRRLYDKWIAPRRVPLPSIVLVSSFVEYSDRQIPTFWSEVGDWARFWSKPWDGFSPYLPGFDKVMQHDGLRGSIGYNRSVATQLKEAMETSVLSDDTSETSSGITFNTGMGFQVVPCKVSTAVVVAPLVKPVRVESGRVLKSSDVAAVVDRVMDHQGYAINTQADTLVRYVPLVDSVPFQDAHNGLVDSPIQLLPEVMGRIFPESTLMQTSFASADIHYGSMELMARAVRIKIDAGKLSPMRPERIYRPKMPNQLLPNARQTMQATLPTVVKRNLNTTSSVDPLCVDEMWERTWGFMKTVYYVHDVEAKLQQMEDIRPTVENVAMWASKLEPEVRLQVAERNFKTENLLECMKHSKLMLKAKRKANLGPSYDAAVKAAQSIQFDSTKVRTGVYSSMFQEKVRRDKSVLKDNVFIMQSKSPADLKSFLSSFTWRDGGRGPLRYMEIDAEMFDKSQILTTLMMHWKKSEKFGMLPSYVELLREGTTYRDASSIQAGVKAFITPQRGSGDSDTLDGNSDVSQVAYARFFASFVEQIEFILIMGDDVTVAFRGDVNYEHLEADCMKEFNLSVKLTVSEFGYFVSGWIVHYPDGSVSWCTDPIKRAVSLGDQSVNEGVDLDERFVGFNDLCKDLSGCALQQYVAKAATARYGLTLGVAIDVKDVEVAIKCVATIASSKKLFRSFFSSELFKRTA